MTFIIEREITPAGHIRMAVILDEQVVWPHPHNDDGTADFDPEDVLAYLTDSWPSLMLAQSWPIAFASDQEPRSITGLMRAAEDRWSQTEAMDRPTVQEEGALIEAFLYAHDLSQMKFAAGLRPFLVLRQNNVMRIETNGEVDEQASFKSFFDQLTGLGDLAAGQLALRSDTAAAHLRNRWANRDLCDPVHAASLVSGVSREEIESSEELRETLVGSFRARALSEIANDNANPILAAARSSGVLGLSSLTQVLRRIQAMPAGQTTAIVIARRRIQPRLRGLPAPLDQGIVAASLIREWASVAEDGPVDLDALSRKLAIAVERQSIPDDRLDGIVSYGPAHGPAILLNVETRLRGSGEEDLERSLRFTWAHEIGHLLLDTDEWPAMVDALRQRVPRSIETRANAFAAYLLLPSGAALRCWQARDVSLDGPAIIDVLRDLTSTYRVSRVLAARRLGFEAPPERRRGLETLLSAHGLNR